MADVGSRVPICIIPNLGSEPFYSGRVMQGLPTLMDQCAPGLDRRGRSCAAKMRPHSWLILIGDAGLSMVAAPRLASVEPRADKLRLVVMLGRNSIPIRNTAELMEVTAPRFESHSRRIKISMLC